MASPEPSEHQDVPGIVASHRATRVTAAELGVSAKARLLPGGEVDVLNLSGTGLLVEGKSRPVIGTVVSIRLNGARLKRLDGRIVRSRVSTIHRDGTLSYESAIEFDHAHAVEDLVNAGAEKASAPSSGEVTPNRPTDEDVYVLDTDNDW